MIDVCLIQPPMPALADPQAYPPLGLLRLASYLLCNDVSVSVVNLAVEKPSAIVPAMTYGVTVTSANVAEAKKVVYGLRKKFPYARIVLGGPHITDAYKYAKEDFGACLSEIFGEEDDNWTMCERGGEEFLRHEVAGSGNAIRSLVCPVPSHLELMPARHLLNYKWWTNSPIHGCDGKRSTTVITSEGCPFSCAYCGQSNKTDVRFRTASHVQFELETLQNKYGIRHIRFVDDVFTLNKRRLSDICYYTRMTGLTWISITRADLFDDVTAEEMARSGCKEVCFGVESGYDPLLLKMGKRETADDNARAIELARKHGIKSKVFLIFGFPGESRTSLAATKQFMKRTKPDSYTLSAFTPLPNSIVWNEPERFGIENAPWLNNYNYDFSKGWFYWDDAPDAAWHVNYPNIDELKELRPEFSDYLRRGEWR